MTQLIASYELAIGCESTASHPPFIPPSRGHFFWRNRMLVFICVACKHKHDSGDRVEKLGVRYTMCPKCGCGGFTKREE